MTTAATPVKSHAFPWAFVLRRLHSLSGVVPIGVFLCEHLFTNAQIIRGGAEYNHDVWFLHSLPALRLLEIFGIWLPIGFHAALGVYYALSKQRSNPIAYPYADNWRYTLQRWTAYVALVFIFLHLWTVQWGFAIGAWRTPFDVADPTGSTAYAIQFAAPWVMLMYLVGVAATVYHFANGMWTFAISWGLTTTEAAMRRWGYVCAALGLALGAFGLGAVIWFYTYDLEAHQPPRVVPSHIQAETGEEIN